MRSLCTYKSPIKRSVAILLLISFHQINLFSQDKLSDLTAILLIENKNERLDTLEKYARSIVFKDAEVGLKAGIALYNEARSLKDKKRVLISYNVRGLSLYYLERNDEAQLCLDSMVQMCAKEKDTLMEAKARGNLGMVLERKTDYKSAFHQYAAALKLAEQANNKSITASSCGNLGNVSLRLERNIEAVEYLERAATLFAELGNMNAAANQYNSLAQAYEELKESKKSHDYSLRAEKIYRELGNKRALATVLLNLGTYEKDHGNPKESIRLDEEALKLKLETNELNGAAVAMINLSLGYVNLGLFDKGEAMIDSAEAIATKGGDLFLLNQVLMRRAVLHKTKGDYKKGYAYLLEYIDAKDELVGEQTQKAVVELKEKYESEKKEFEIDKLKKAGEIDALKIKQHRGQLFALFGGLFVVCVFGVLMYNRFRITKKQKRIIEAQKMVVEEQKLLVEEKQKEVMDSIKYARRIQMAQIPSEKRVSQILKKLKENER